MFRMTSTAALTAGGEGRQSEGSSSSSRKSGKLKAAFSSLECYIPRHIVDCIVGLEPEHFSSGAAATSVVRLLFDSSKWPTACSHMACACKLSGAATAYMSVNAAYICARGIGKETAPSQVSVCLFGAAGVRGG